MSYVSWCVRVSLWRLGQAISSRPSRRLMLRRRTIPIRIAAPPLEEVVKEPVRNPGAVCSKVLMKE